ncbi:MAG: hypothetical protein J1E85_05080 [Ruminococcus sp.]|nr:hypothetical protein [Ruminococcus sp.]
MKIFKRLLLVVILLLVCIFSVPNVYAESSPDQSILTAADDKYVPLYTTAPNSDSRLDVNSNPDETSKDYTLFYTQTTFLALLAGYLIIFKVKGIDHSQKMHRRRISDD